MVSIPISSITIGVRRREDDGDIGALARSIKRYGLLHPVVIDESNRLVAGGRRLRACQSLGWTEIDIRTLGELSSAERSAIELEENIQRKDLTEWERSKALVKFVETAKEIDQEELRTNLVRNGVGRPRQPGSVRSAATRIGVPPMDVEHAIQHVAAVERFPILKDEPKTVAIDYARAVEEFPELSPEASPGLPVKEVVQLADAIRHEPEAEQPAAREAIASWYKVYQAHQENETAPNVGSLAYEAIKRLRLCRLTVEKAGGVDAIVAYLLTRGESSVASWLYELDQSLPILARWKEVMDANQ